jgi:branched-subunit amino acid aminotransferase/4-amino-4-deoxychorismate lyase
VLNAAAALGIPVSIEDVRPDALDSADEVFVTNAVTGVRAVGELMGVRKWEAGAVTRQLMARAHGTDA